jgi:hypothetical protein
MSPQAAALSPTGAATFAFGPTGPGGPSQREDLAAYRTATGQRIAVVHPFPATGMVTENPLLATGHVTQLPGHSARSAASLAW